MERTLARFVTALRNAEVRVSPAETLDALAIIDAVGVTDFRLLKDALSLALAKTIGEKARFDDCFDRFFHQLAFARGAKSSFFRDIERAELADRASGVLPAPAAAVVSAILHDDRTTLAAQVEEAARASGIDRMAALRDRSVVAAHIADALGIDALAALANDSDIAWSNAERHALRYVRSYAADEIKQYVDTQYRLRVDASGRRALIAAALESNLNRIPPDYHDAVKESVRAIAARLKRGRRRRRRGRRGALDVKRTLRRNLGYDEALFALEWRTQRRQEATVFVLCDVSNSVAATARFLLLLVYELAEVLPRVRTFAFSSRLGEITSRGRSKAMDVAIETALFDWGKGTTDYGHAWLDFRELAGRELNHRSTVIVLGDARSNFFDPRIEHFRAIAHRAGRTLWLNPEPVEQWGDGDSEMRRYAVHCTRVWRVGSLADLERIAATLINELD